MVARMTTPKRGKDVEETLENQAKFIAGIRKRDAAAAATAKKKREDSRLAQLKRNIKRLLKPKHSPAGKRYLKGTR